ncbi:MAG: DNA double-strand break repair nuclease NurA [Actinomycetota bacterium]
MVVRPSLLPVRLRADPWAPDHGMGFEAVTDEIAPRVDPAVETADWSLPRSLGAVEECPLHFVDGVRRVELRLIAEQQGRRVPGLFGSSAVGAVRCDGDATFADAAIARFVILGGGVRGEAVDVRAPNGTLRFEPVTEAGDDPDVPLMGLQQLMRKAEAGVAARVAAAEGELVLVDGPLMFSDPTQSPVVGVVKRFVRAYLDGEHDALLAKLGAGERTPLFGLGRAEGPLDRYAWYARLVPSRPHWHDHAGVVRCELRSDLGLERAVEIADRVTSVLPRFAGRPSDPRYPQNLSVVGRLEEWLRHRLGHAAIVRRSLIRHLTLEAA